MVSINTNLSSIMVQGNLNKATSGMNKAVERLSTGYKINHSSDNAANYSIATNYESKLSSYDMAASNISMGLDLLSVAQDTISTMQNHGARLQALITQARNGTYGTQSLTAMTQEAGALISEITRMYTNTEYNGISLFDNLPLPEWAKEVKATAGTDAGVNLEPKYNGFIADAKTYTDEQVAAMTKVSDVESFTAGQKYSISSKEELAKLATKVNGGTDTTNVEFVLGDDIDLSSIENWNAIGQSTASKRFKGTFDGNGHIIKNLKIDKSTTDYQGLFGFAASGSEIKNVGVVDCDIKGKAYTGGLVGDAYSSVINCYSTGTVIGVNYIGGLVGDSSEVTNCYSTGTVNGTGNFTGGLVGMAWCNILNCYSVGNVSGAESVGGLVGYTDSNSSVKNCYTTGDVTGNQDIGGLIGIAWGDVQNCFTTGNVSGKDNVIGGLIGVACKTVRDCYSTGDVIGNNGVGGSIGLASFGRNNVTIENAISYGNVTGNDGVGSFIGGGIYKNSGSSVGTLSITNCISTKQAKESDIKGFTWDSTNEYLIDNEYDISTIERGIKEIDKPKTTLQVGINGDSSSQITFDTGLDISLNAILSDIKSDKAYSAIAKFMSSLSEKATELGAASNRLESSLESVIVNMENLTSSLSTIKDADVATTSSQYIKMQILQQASATLLATANQSPSIALQLI